MITLNNVRIMISFLKNKGNKKRSLRVILLLVLLKLTSVTTFFVVLPYFFKDDIEKAIHKVIEDKIDASVYLNTDKFSLSLFRSFPRLSVRLGEMGIVGKGVFDNDTLLHTNNLELAVDVLSLFKDDIKIKNIHIDNPIINIIYSKDGSVNYDIVISDDSLKQEEKKDSDFSHPNLNLDSWKITNGILSYRDSISNTFLTIFSLNQKGSFSIKPNEYVFNTETEIEKLNFSQEDVDYASDLKLFFDINGALNLDSLSFVLEKTRIKINELAVSLDGELKILDNGYDIDMKFSSADTEFKHVVSLLPFSLVKDISEWKTGGSFNLSAWIKGRYDYSSTLLPPFKLDFKIDDGNLRHPSLASSVKDIFLSLSIDGSSGDLSSTSINISNLSMNLDNNPITAKVYVLGISNNPYIDAYLNASVNLESLNKVFPMDSVTMGGLYFLETKLKGNYDIENNYLPIFEVRMKLDNGFIKHQGHEENVEDIDIDLVATNTTKYYKDTRIRVDRLYLKSKKNTLAMKGTFSNLDDINYDVTIDSDIDIKSLNDIYPLQGFNMSGTINANIEAKGTQSYILQEDYSKLHTSGTIDMQNISIESDSMPKITIDKALLTFFPSYIALNDYVGTIGNSDLKIEGKVTNYMNYFMESSDLNGTLSLNSTYLDINEWMGDETTDAQLEDNEEDDNEETYELAMVPKNLNFSINTNIDKIDLLQMNVTDFSGQVVLKDGILNLNDVVFNLLGGKIVANGSYNTLNEEEGSVLFDMQVQDISFKELYSTFEVARDMAPIMKNMNGKFSSNLTINSDITKGYNLLYESLYGNGSLTTSNVDFKGFSVINNLADKANISQLKDPSINDISALFSIREGKLYVEPFDGQF